MSRLLKSITTSDQHVIATMTKITANNAKRDDFELDAEFLLLASPQKKVMNMNSKGYMPFTRVSVKIRKN